MVVWQSGRVGGTDRSSASNLLQDSQQGFLGIIHRGEIGLVNPAESSQAPTFAQEEGGCR